MSRLPLRGRLKAVAVDSVRLLNSPSTRKDNLVLPAMCACPKSAGVPALLFDFLQRLHEK